VLLDLGAADERARAFLVTREPALRKEVVDSLSLAAKKLGRLEDRQIRALGLQRDSGKTFLKLSDPGSQQRELLVGGDVQRWPLTGVE